MGTERHDLDEVDGDVAVAVETRAKVKKPSLYKVMLHNDDYTTMEFVVLILESIFHRDETDAVQIMLRIHENGVGVAGIYSYEVAETKILKTTELAKQYEYPLRCTMEPE